MPFDLAAVLAPALAPLWQQVESLPDRPAAADIERLRRAAATAVPEIDPDLVREIVTQALLRREARPKFGGLADRMLFTRAGLQQASRPLVAGRRAQRLAQQGRTALLDLGCGIGVDGMAAARLGLAVTAVEQDHLTAAVARVNLAAAAREHEPAPSVRVDVTDLRGTAVPPHVVAFVDPGRRAGTRPDGTERRVLAPERWQPPWSWVTELARRHSAVVAKVAPGIGHELLPADAEVEWVSVAGRLVEATVWFAGVATAPGARRAVLLEYGPNSWQPGAEHRLEGSADPAPTGPLGSWLLEPDPAVVRAHLIGELCQSLAGRALSPGIAYLTTDARPATPFGRAWPVEDVLPADPSALRRALRARGVGSAEIRTRGLALDPDVLRRRLRLNGKGARAHLVLTRLEGRPAALLLGAAVS